MTEPVALGWVIHRLDRELSGEHTFQRLFARAEPAFWLDSSLPGPPLGCFSVMGCSAGPDAEVICYRVQSADEPPGGVFDLLRRRIARRSVPDEQLPDALRRTFAGGYVGYFGYELKALCGGTVRHRSPTPDALWIWANRFVVLDHERRETLIVAVYDGGSSSEESAAAWADRATRALRAGSADGGPARTQTEDAVAYTPAEIERALALDRGRYLQAIDTCHEKLLAGETYEICLTNRINLPPIGDPLAFYLAQRKRNPAPFAALLRAEGIFVASSSPERFVKVDEHREVECKPIKGTAPRGDTEDADRRAAEALARDPKSRAENLMIVDLIRNDLSRTCRAGSVHVPVLMGVESYASVHQLVTTVRGTLKSGVDALSCVEASFPPGSMTGAPKIRTMEIIDALEPVARGIYSGALGYLGIDGRADLSVVIRTAVCTPTATTVGAGGAIVLDSDREEEYAEMLLKASAPLSHNDAPWDSP